MKLRASLNASEPEVMVGTAAAVVVASYVFVLAAAVIVIGRRVMEKI